MPVAYLLGLAETQFLDFPRLPPSRLAYVGLRDLDLAEKKLLRHLKARGTFVATMTDVDAFGIGHVMRAAFDSLGYAPDDDATADDRPPLHLSYDVDAVDPQHAPATGTAVRGGLSFREAHYICEAAWATGALGSMDIVEVNESLADAAHAQQTVNLAASLVASACGDAIL
mmetsp:Transcript_29326/g.94616  ORF Transcript_29326/g.94616 Transcript_29326/m.94616 type:complete len:171 (+) Transcript_29326:621-1133(+)